MHRPGTFSPTPTAPESAPPIEEAPPELEPRRLGRRVLQLGLLVVVVVVAVSALPGLGEVRERFTGARPGWLAAALVLEVASVLSFVAAFRGVYCPRLSWRLSYQIAMAEQAANVLLPTGGAGGLALGAWALRRGGMSVARIARRTVAFFLVTSSVNFAAAILAGTALATGLLTGAAPLALTLGPAALAAATVLAVAALPRLLPGGAVPEGRRRRARLAGATLADGIRDALALVRSGRPLVVAGALGYMAFDVATLAAAFQAFGGGPPVGVLVLAYALGQLGGLIPLPGGIGGTHGGLIAALVLYGTSLSAAIAAVLAYRTFQLGLPALAGTVAFGQLRRTLARSPTAAAACEPPARAAA